MGFLNPSPPRSDGGEPDDDDACDVELDIMARRIFLPRYEAKNRHSGKYLAGDTHVGDFTAWPRDTLYNQSCTCKLHASCVYVTVATKLKHKRAFSEWLARGMTVNDAAAHKAAWSLITDVSPAYILRPD